MPFHVSIATRRQILDELQASNVEWFGAVDDVTFLEPLWDLTQLPSRDPRFKNAAGDIYQHRINNGDWASDWLFHDDRFDLMHCESQLFVEFLARCVEPVVRRDPDEAERLVRFFNACLAYDGIELKPQPRPTLAGSKRYAYRPAVNTPPLSTLQRFDRLADPAALADHLRRIDAGVDSDPALAIGSSKELIESLCKLVLDDYGETYVERDDLLDLYKKAAAVLRLNAEAVPASSKGSESAQKALRAMVVTVQSLAELRNELGLGHGRTKTSAALSRHARLASAAARGISEFMLETWHVRKSREQPASQDMQPKPPSTERPARARRFKEGDRVDHPSFGHGSVIKSTMTATDEEVLIRFDRAGLKILSGNVAPLSVARNT